MKHARSDYNCIQDPSGKIPDDEPVFLLRGKDICAPEIIERWAYVAGQAGASKTITDAALYQAQAMREYQQGLGECKIPDMPESAKVPGLFRHVPNLQMWPIAKPPEDPYDFEKIPITILTEIPKMGHVLNPGIYYYYTYAKGIESIEEVSQRILLEVKRVLTDTVNKRKHPAGIPAGSLSREALGAAVKYTCMAECDHLLSLGINPIRLIPNYFTSGGMPVIMGASFIALDGSIQSFIMHIPGSHPPQEVAKEFTDLALYFGAYTKPKGN